jgi:RES domain-containing protein
MLRSKRLATALAKIQLVSTHGPWSRTVGLRHILQPPGPKRRLLQPLWGGAAQQYGARFTPTGGFESIYLSYDPITAFIEVSALVVFVGGPVPIRSAPWTVISVEGVTNGVLDLTDSKTLSILRTNEQEITGTWVKATSPPTQELGQAAYNSGRIVGIKYGSAKHRGGVNLVVFPDRLVNSSSSYLEVYDPHGNCQQRIGA